MVYQARQIKRRRSTKAQVEQLDRQIMEVLAEDHPQSVRNVFYRMTDPRLPEQVEKSDRGYNQLQARITKLRREGRLPYGYISDTTRRGYHVSTFDGASDFMRRMAGMYRANLWEQSNWHVEVWCESRSIAGIIQGTCEELAVSLYPTGGFSSITLIYEAAEYLNNVAYDRNVEIVYIGDYDPAGVLIDKQVERELRDHLDPHIPLQFTRLGITLQQIERYDLPTKPRKAGDKRSLHISETVEAEAMPAVIMKENVREHVEQFLPVGALEAAKVAERSEREFIQNWAQELQQ